MNAFTTAERAPFAHDSYPNERRVGQGERLASTILGSGMLLAGVRCLARGRPVRGVALTAIGGMLASRGATGRCAAYRRLGVESDDAYAASNPVSRHIHVRHAVAISAPPGEIYAKWRDLSSLPSILSHVDRVDVIDDRRSRWFADGPMGADVSWEAVIEQDQPGRLISWRSTSDSTVETEGRVEFIDAPGGRGTIMRVDLVYHPPGGVIGAAAAKLFRADPDREIREDLRRFKQTIEAGEVSTSEGPSGRAASRLAPGRASDVDAGRRSIVPESERRAPEARRLDTVEEASKESFPASDAPAW